MGSGVIFTDDLTDQESKQLYTRLALLKGKDADSEQWHLEELEELDEVGVEESIIKTFEKEQYERQGECLGASKLFQIPVPSNSILHRYLNGDVIKSANRELAEAYLSIEVLYYTKGRFMQLGCMQRAVETKLVGVLALAEGEFAVQWFVDLLCRGAIDLRGLYRCELRKGEKGEGYMFIIRAKHEGIFKRVAEFALEERPSVEMNAHLLEDLNKMYVTKCEMQAQEAQWADEKETLVKMILRFSDLLSINDLTRTIGNANKKLKEALAFDIVESKRKYPISRLDSMVKQAQEMFTSTIPSFYVPLLQSLQNRVNGEGEDHKQEDKQTGTQQEKKRKHQEHDDDTAGLKRPFRETKADVQELKVEEPLLSELEDGYETPQSSGTDIEVTGEVPVGGVEHDNLSEETDLSGEDVLSNE